MTNEAKDISRYKIIDAFPEFLAFWERACQWPLDAQIEGWASEYMASWPELLQKQLQDYGTQDIDWRQIARGKVFPFLGERLPDMREAHVHLAEICASVGSKAQEALGFAGDLIYVMGLHEIALLDDIERQCRPLLQRRAAAGSGLLQSRFS